MIPNIILIMISAVLLISALVTSVLAEEKSSLGFAVATFVLTLLGVILLVAGVFYEDPNIGNLRAQCNSVEGHYSNGKCFKDGKELEF